MRHYFGYNNDGTLVSFWAAQGGHPPEFDLHNKESDNQAVKQAYVEHIKKHPGFAGFIAFDCRCQTTNHCDCSNRKYYSSYVKDGKLVSKLDASFLLDGQPQESLHLGQLVNKEPGAKIRLSVVCNLPDGETIKLAPGPGPALHRDFPAHVTLIMSSGVSQETIVVVPAQGLTGSLSVIHNRVKSGSLWLRGFAS